MKYFFPALLLLVIFSCEKSKDQEQIVCCTAPISLSAIVEQTADIACGKPLIFVADTTALKYYPTLAGQRFVLDQLPDSLKFVNKKIRLIATIIPAEKEFACLTIGVPYPHLLFIAGRTE